MVKLTYSQGKAQICIGSKNAQLSIKLMKINQQHHFFLTLIDEITRPRWISDTLMQSEMAARLLQLFKTLLEVAGGSRPELFTSLETQLVQGRRCVHFPLQEDRASLKYGQKSLLMRYRGKNLCLKMIQSNEERQSWSLRSI